MRKTILSNTSMSKKRSILDKVPKAVMKELGDFWRYGVDESKIIKFLNENKLDGRAVLKEFKMSKNVEQAASQFDRYHITWFEDGEELEAYCKTIDSVYAICSSNRMTNIQVFDTFEHKVIHADWKRGNNRRN